MNYIDHERPHLFARPSSSSMIDAMFDFLPSDNHRRFWWSVIDHNNGLVLCDMETDELCVCNPVTRRWTVIPWPWRPVGGIYITFDPALSPHYEVFVIPAVPEPEKPVRRADEKCSNEKPLSLGPPYVDEDDDTRRLMESEWPPTPWTMNVFSSERRGILSAKVSRLSLSNGTYQVVKAPTYNEEKRQVKPYLGISKKGVYFGVIEGASRLLVWILAEYSSGQMEWILRHQDGLSHCGQHIRNCFSNTDTPWMIHDVPDTGHEDVDAATTLPKERFEWDSDNDDFLTIRFAADSDWVNFAILGFHPYKEVVYLSADMFDVVAYHLSDSKIQYLGYSRPKSYYRNWTNGIYESFVYTPQMVGELEEECVIACVED
uniref:DUF1618 domain-containing protein n=1 Tax=Aegilops tauschii TaxID=37682 RepID=R7W721_AEGTA